MPQITVTLTESEATYIRELCVVEHEVCKWGIANRSEISDFYETVDTLNVSIIEKLKDA